jgi:hypothetical protein
MSCRQRQIDELHCLCRAGEPARAIDLAFEHFARFGRDETVVDLLEQAVDRAPASQRIQSRLSELLERTEVASDRARRVARRARGAR